MAVHDPGPPAVPQIPGAPVHPGEPAGAGPGGSSGAPLHPGEPPDQDLDRDVDPEQPYRARQLAPYRRDAGLYDSGLTGRYLGLRGSGARDPRIRSSGPSPGGDQNPERASMLAGRTAIVATIVVGSCGRSLSPSTPGRRTAWARCGCCSPSRGCRSGWRWPSGWQDHATAEEEVTIAIATDPLPGRNLALALATVAFAVNFWAWSLLSPLAPRYQELLGLSPLAVSVMVAVPVIVGSLGRIPLGALTDRYGGRIVFALLSFVTIAPVVFLAFATAYPALLLGGLVLGLGGASFAVGVPFVNAWFPPERRGFALGLYGMGNIGTAISGFLTPRIADSLGRPWAFLVVAVGLAAVGLAFLLVGRDAPGRARATEPFMVRFAAALRLRIARDLAVLYAITFGGFVAFGVYLPTFLKAVYGLGTTDAASRAAGFVLLATLARPVGGWLSDRFSGVQVLLGALAVVAVGAVVTAFQPHIALATVAFLSMAAALGLGNGAVFALVGKTVPAVQVGSVTGLVGAAGGLGGFLPPIVMGLVFQATGDYAIGLMLLSDVALAGLVYTAWRLGAGAAQAART